ncbi:carbamoyltransferase HypF [Leminorella grimontii]|uniref:Carbamoyltransferase HypF n=1 Tax=Leminorella grimontii TaxID=82981 RepID=A0AAV5NAA1_9GAMM|nr:carbamoyltransferase HypF [Leminorella grimontii]KFC92766.1 HypF family [NiFe] hydrogenase metallocenter assembly protein [Leminorella grimontii ATCC 33999 = DSM 5078]GKX57542.1 carbamoyltransferase HypF [Leminorella grimontii]VFS62381.1 Carbamoyltransferase hypF [Leminorella grimontii]
MPGGIQLRIKGKVQGVGFRPYVWQLAHEMRFLGDVCNDAEGVLVRLLADAVPAGFLEQLYARCPPLARIESVTPMPFDWPVPPTDFSIRSSGEGPMDTQVIPDAATCPACLKELFDGDNRRFRYPFTNCTHCGPRFTIIRKMPYDRPFTAMASFPLCPQCRMEYESPADRRFHAQPNACSVCGPYVWLSKASDVQPTGIVGDLAIEKAAELLLNGGVLAIKGLGGFHLACDATSDDAVNLLRKRKRRPTKPLAVMLPSADWLSFCSRENEPALRQLLQSGPAPIVLVETSLGSPLSRAVCPGLDEVGLMLPANPLQHLLMAKVGRPLVMTSGNASGKPPALSNEQALADLGNIADLFLMHNRDIVQRADDSVVRWQHGRAEMLRRSRGYVPDAIELPAGFDDLPPLLAMGADLKNAFCLLRGNAAVLSQHLGDLDDVDIEQQYRSALTLFEDIYRFTPSAIAVDAHPGYVSHRLGRELAEKESLPLIEVLHHHAHIAATMAEHGWRKEDGAAIGLALDGLGYGESGQLWGGECLLVDYRQCQRLGGLPAVAMPGGDRASQEPWRNLLAQWLRFVPDWQSYPEASVVLAQPWQPLAVAIERGLNSPQASSCGRLFDAVAAAMSVSPNGISWEGEAACRLEAIARQCCCNRNHPVTMPFSGETLDLATFWRQWLAYRAPMADRAFAFHQALANGMADMARAFAQRHGVSTVALAGGVVHNRLLRTLLVERLEGLRVIYPERLPMGDGGLALGQAIVAASRR